MSMRFVRAAFVKSSETKPNSHPEICADTAPTPTAEPQNKVATDSKTPTTPNSIQTDSPTLN
jgi:hypothetical protein